MLLSEIINAIEEKAPLVYQESYDNCGLQVGNMNSNISAVLIALEVTEGVLEEAIQKKSNLIVTHHPLIFSGLKKLTGRNYVERIVMKAIKHDIAVYSAHTNLDNVQHGVNAKFAEKLGLQRTVVLAPTQGNLYKLCTYAPILAAEKIRNAMFNAGAGSIGNYSDCSFNSTGFGTFRPNENAIPHIGIAGGKMEKVEETKIEVIMPVDIKNAVIRAMLAAHPYEEVAYDIVPLSNANKNIGAGMVGWLPEPMDELSFLTFLKYRMKTDCIRHTTLTNKKISKVALCGGSGSFLLKEAMQAKADVFVTGDFKYHQFFDSEGQILIADIGHYESEQFTTEIFETILKRKFPNFAVLLSDLNTNPVQYFY